MTFKTAIDQAVLGAPECFYIYLHIFACLGREASHYVKIFTNELTT